MRESVFTIWVFRLAEAREGVIVEGRMELDLSLDNNHSGQGIDGFEDNEVFLEIDQW